MSDTSYEELPYSQRVHFHTHPRVLATTAALLGMPTAAIEQARVLELGCACGSNLLAMAAGMPAARFVGIDYSPGQIASAREMASAAAVGNVEFHCQSIADAMPEERGPFDFIIAHGLFSWIPDDLRRQLLPLCRSLLSAHGILYVSHNTLPGWHPRRSIRDLMLFHARRQQTAPAQVAGARAIVDHWADALADQETPYARLLQSERATIQRLDDAYVFHDYMEADNHAVYLEEIAAMAGDAGLQFLADAAFVRRRLDDLQPALQRFIAEAATDVVGREQYVDYLFNESFRRTLFCQADIDLASAPVLSVIEDCFVAIQASAMEQVSEQEDVYRSAAGAELSITQPVLRLLMRMLAECRPRALPVSALLARLAGQAGVDGAVMQEWRQGLFLWLLRARENGFITLSSTAYRYATQLSARPRAPALARWQAGQGEEVANLRQENIQLDDFLRALLSLLDGRRDQPQLLAALRQSQRTVMAEKLAQGLAFLLSACLLEDEER